MRKYTTVLTLAVSAAFVAGLAASPLAQRVFAEAHAEAAPLSPAMIDLAAITHASLPRTGNPELNSRMLVSAEGATISIQKLSSGLPVRGSDACVIAARSIMAGDKGAASAWASASTRCASGEAASPATKAALTARVRTVVYLRIKVRSVILWSI